MNYTQKTIEEEKELERQLLDEILNGEEPEYEEGDISDEEFDRLCLELKCGREEIFKDLKEEPITDQEYREMEAGPYERLYDPALEEWTIAKEIEAFYGKDILWRMIKELQKNMLTELHGKISKELYHEMKCLREGIQPKNATKKEPSKPKKNNKKAEIETFQRERQPGDHYFHRIERGVILNESYRKTFSGPAAIIYQWLWSQIARKQWKDTPDYPLKKNYFDKGFLACSMSLRHIAEKCCLNKNTAKKHIDILEKENVIKVEQFTPKGKKRGQNVYILGKWKKTEGGEIQETYFLNQVYLSKK